jgi:hypothetical protein
MRIAETEEVNALPHTPSKMSVDSQGAERSGGYAAVRYPRTGSRHTENSEGEGGLIVNAQMCR